jgi:3-oxoacyl-[acyl-carrier protein] reductase
MASKPQGTRIVLVTGGNRGIGLSIARSFASNGDLVIVSYRSGGAPQGLVGVQMDVTNQESVDAAFTEIEEKYGVVDVLIANAGITRDGLAMRMSEADFTDVVETNLTEAENRASNFHWLGRWIIGFSGSG